MNQDTFPSLRTGTAKESTGSSALFSEAKLRCYVFVTYMLGSFILNSANIYQMSNCSLTYSPKCSPVPRGSSNDSSEMKGNLSSCAHLTDDDSMPATVLAAGSPTWLCF